MMFEVILLWRTAQVEIFIANVGLTKAIYFGSCA